MAKNPKIKRTQIKDLSVAEQALSEQEMEQVQGGTSNLNLSKSNINVAPPPSVAIPASEKKGPNAVNVKLA